MSPNPRVHDPNATQWMRDAACKGMDPQLFHPDSGDHRGLANAKAVCAKCPVRDACREYAIADTELHGVWGGLSHKQRRAIRKRQQADGEKRPPKPIIHGERNGANLHRKRGEEACQVCLDAEARWRDGPRYGAAS